MGNCNECKHRKTMLHNVFGCEKHKKVIMNPNEEKECCEAEGFMNFFNEVIKNASTKQ